MYPIRFRSIILSIYTLHPTTFKKRLLLDSIEYCLRPSGDPLPKPFGILYAMTVLLINEGPRRYLAFGGKYTMLRLIWRRNRTSLRTNTKSLKDYVSCDGDGSKIYMTPSPIILRRCYNEFTTAVQLHTTQPNSDLEDSTL
ncbi:hypothetical protein Tco_0067199 [Tanacetum coccineum]